MRRFAHHSCDYLTPQRQHWKGGHKQTCAAGAAAAPGSPSSAALQPDPDPDVKGQAGEWAAMHLKYIHKLITTQSARMKRMPYIEDSDHLQRHIAAGITKTLTQDFTWSLSFRPKFYADLMYEGFLSIASELSDDGLLVLMPKLHSERCALQWPDLHVSSKAKKRCGR
jgi:hypothetical protein